MAVTKVTTNAELNSQRDKRSTDIANLAVGTSNAAPTAADAALGAEVQSKAATAANGGIGEVTHSMKLNAADAVGQTLRELGGKTSGGELRYRVVHTDLAKTGSMEVEYRVKSKIRNP